MKSTKKSILKSRENVNVISIEDVNASPSKSVQFKNQIQTINIIDDISPLNERVPKSPKGKPFSPQKSSLIEESCLSAFLDCLGRKMKPKTQKNSSPFLGLRRKKFDDKKIKDMLDRAIQEKKTCEFAQEKVSRIIEEAQVIAKEIIDKKNRKTYRKSI